jgi:hypothetical protein
MTAVPLLFPPPHASFLFFLHSRSRAGDHWRLAIRVAHTRAAGLSSVFGEPQSRPPAGRRGMTTNGTSGWPGGSRNGLPLLSLTRTHPPTRPRTRYLGLCRPFSVAAPAKREAAPRIGPDHRAINPAINQSI